MTNGRQSLRTAAATAACASSLILAGCGGSSHPGAQPASAGPATVATSATTSAAPAPTSADPTAVAQGQALEVYKNMIKAFTAAVENNAPGQDLVDTTTTSAFVFFSQGISSQVDSGIIYTGVPQSSPKISATDLAGAQPSITVTDCFGGPNFVPVFAVDNPAEGHKKGQSALVPGHPATLSPLTVVLIKQNGKWLVDKYSITAGATC